MKRLTKHLLDKSQEAFVLGLELYNKPTIKYRIEGFCFLFCNAWELLLKARILETQKSAQAIYYKKKRNQPRRSLSLRACLKRVITNENDPVRRNVEDIAAIRDAAAHLIVRELEVVYSGLFQSGVLNYVDKLQEWFGVSITDTISPAMLTLVSDIKRIDPAVIKRRYGVETLSFIENEMARLETSERQINDLKYRIPIEYRLVLTKKSKNADISLSSGPDGKAVGLIEVPKDIERTHPHLQKDILARVKESLPNDVIFNKYDFQAILHKEKIKGNYKHHYMIKKPPVHRYSDALITFILDRIRKDRGYLGRARERLGRHRRDLRQRRSDMQK